VVIVWPGMAMGASSVHEMLFDPLAVFIRRFLILALVSIWAWDKLLDFLQRWEI
jgi:membrane protein implicated in regulation of membrane protease activity